LRKAIAAFRIKKGNYMESYEKEDQTPKLATTYYCNHTNHEIQNLAANLAEGSGDQLAFVQRAFQFVREKIVFGGDIWHVKASETLKKGYGACYNKNVLLISLLRARGIPAVLGANPMKHDFMRPAMGWAYVLVSKPFRHCFTTLTLNRRNFIIDPTLDSITYDTFFLPLNVDWNAGWDGKTDMLLYTESIAGPAEIFPRMDDAINRNLDSHFLFKNEPDWLLRQWLKLGNNMMWKKTGRFPSPEIQYHPIRGRMPCKLQKNY